MKFNKIFGFSLIELSIVLIIIGLLVAGVTSGQSLIESAKIRAFVNETNNYKRAINIFYASNGRLPGDKDNSGVLVYNSADECTWGNSNYGADLQKSQDMYEELYDDGALDTKLSFEDCIGTEECIGKVTLGSKAFKDGAYSFSCIKSYDDRWSFFENFAGGNVLIFDSNYYTFDSNIAKKIDTILDDGVFNTGQVIFYTFNCEEDYDECDKGVAEMFFKLDI